jgi:predicted polyphosphate/ATP-dependent NAD kinase
LIYDPSLVGVDLCYLGQVIARDAHEQQIYNLIQSYPKCRIILSVIGGQGVVLGRGNQQISPRIIEHCGLDALQFISTQNKLRALQGRALQVDSGSNELNQKLAGFHKIVCGYEDYVLYEIAYL